MDLKIQLVQARDWADVRDLRLSMLREAPDAFDASLEEAAQLEERDWRDLATSMAIYVLARDAESDEVVGGVSIEPWGSADATPALVQVDSLFVAPDGRGAGVAERLCVALDTIATGLGRDTMRIEVSTASPKARARFESLGFVPTGSSRPLPHKTTESLVEFHRPVDAAGSGGGQATG